MDNHLSGALFMLPFRKTMLWGGESWQVSAHGGGVSSVIGGMCDGWTLAGIVARYRANLLGRRADGGDFPLLFKIIDARERLSVQVHPADDYAARYGQRGKAEMWIVLAARPGAGVWLGFDGGVTPGEFKAMISNNTLEQRLKFLPARPGDVFFIPPGLVHAIGGGLTIAEIQQSSDITYRVYDWGRVDADGRPRELHIEQAGDVVRLEQAGQRAGTLSDGDITYLPACRHFAARTVGLDGDLYIDGGGDSFHILHCVSGDISLDGRALPPGASAVLPAAASCLAAGGGELLDFWLPDYAADYVEPLSAKYSLAKTNGLWYNMR